VRRPHGMSGWSSRVRRDAFGVPHLRAPDVLRLARLQGRVTAQDRAWQIELDRRRSTGESAAWLGESGLSWDVLARRMRLDDTARRCHEALDEEHRGWVTAYAEGVNEVLPEAARASHEMRLLGVQPAEWQPWSPIGVLLVQHAVFGGWATKLWRERVAERLGTEALSWFGMEGALVASGSNAWAVGGASTESGRPLLAADPHRLLEAPGVYQQVGLSCPEFEAVGLAFPGVPGIPHFGQTERVAWVVTNALADDRDLYREKLRRRGGEWQALGPAGWEVVEHHCEEVDVRGEPLVTVDVRETRRGPVVLDDDLGALSLRTPVRVLGRCGLDSSLPLLRARTADEAAAALSRWVEPVNRLLVADTEGAVREVHAGRVPDRDLRAATVPLPAWHPEHRWRGWCDLGVRTPNTPVVVHANQRLEAPVLTTDHAPSHRADRISALLADDGCETVEQAATRQRDMHAPGALRLVRLLENAEPPDALEDRLRRRLLDWDGGMRADSTTAALFARWRHRLVDELLATPALAPLADLHLDVPDVLAPWVSTRARIGLALEHLLLAEPSPVEAPSTIALSALGRVAGEIAADPSVEKRTWGETHRLLPLHALAPTDDAVLAAVLGRLAIGVAGDSDTVLATGSTPGVSDLCVRVPAARVVWDLADRGRSCWVVPLGAHGDPTSRHYLDQLPIWLDGSLVPALHDPTPEPRENR
jgi:penicillin G amidase